MRPIGNQRLGFFGARLLLETSELMGATEILTHLDVPESGVRSVRRDTKRHKVTLHGNINSSGKSGAKAGRVRNEMVGRQNYQHLPTFDQEGRRQNRWSGVPTDRFGYDPENLHSGGGNRRIHQGEMVGACCHYRIQHPFDSLETMQGLLKERRPNEVCELLGLRTS